MDEGPARSEGPGDRSRRAERPERPG